MNEVVFLSTKVLIFLQIDNCMVHLIAGSANNRYKDIRVPVEHFKKINYNVGV